jgi:hypothetical protein
VRGAVGVDYGGACLAGDDDAGGDVSGVAAEGDAGVQAAVGEPGEVECGGAEHADAVNSGGELDRGGEPGLVLAGGPGSGGVTQAARGAGGHPPVTGPGAVPFNSVVLLPQEPRVDDAQDGAPVVQESEGHGAQRDGVGEVGGAVDRVEGPQPSGAGVGGAAFFLAEEPDVGVTSWR